jgi:hypothetical protein
MRTEFYESIVASLARFLDFRAMLNRPFPHEGRRRVVSEGIERDWRVVGADLHRSMDRFNTEHRVADKEPAGAI